MADTLVPIWGYELEYYVNIGTTGETATANWVKATELLTWDDSSDAKTYEPEYIDRKNNPTFTYGRSCSVDMEKDTYKGGAIEAWILTHRNDMDVACQIAKVYTWDGTAPSYTADMANFLFTPTIKNSDTGQPVNSGGTFNMSDESWSEGTFNTTTKAFTAKAAG